MLSFLHRRDYCWKCEFDTDVKIEQKIIITMMENNKVFIKKYISKQRAKRRTFLLVIIILQDTKNCNLFDKNCTQENVKCQIQHEESWLSGKLQVLLLSLIFPESNCDCTLSKSFERSNRDGFWEGEIDEVGCVKKFFVNLQVGILQLHYWLTSSQIIFRDFK